MGAVLLRALQGDSLDSMCWRFYGRTAGMVEMVLDANPGLAELGVILPEGTPVRFPAIEDAPPVEKNMLQLWD